MHIRPNPNFKLVLSSSFALAAISIAFLGTTPAAATQAWTTVPAACASTDNNFYSGTPSAAFPVARFIVPGGRLSFNGSHIGYIAVVCNVDNPIDFGFHNPAWNQLQVTYIDPDGTENPDVHFGASYQVFVQLVRTNKTNGVQNVVAEFNSDNDCSTPGSFCDGTSVRTFEKPFTHTFDFANYAYAVYGRLFRSVVNVSMKPVLIEMRLNAS